MLQKSTVSYTIILLLLFQLLVEINCQAPFKPGERYVHTATHVDNKLYILDGTTNTNDRLNDFFYLDVSVPFNTKELLWRDLNSVNTVPAHFGAASVKGGANNNTLFLYGGTTADDTNAQLVYTYDPQSNSWSTPTISLSGNNPLRKISLSGVVDYNGKMYLWGGGIASTVNGTNDMLTLDTINLIWGTGTSVGAPISRITYGAVLLPNQSILYIGGFNLENDIELTLNQIFIYDTINNMWSPKTTNGKIPSNRDGLTAVLGLDGKRVIIFGGTATADNAPLSPIDSLQVLNLDNFEWIIPKVSVTAGQIPSSRIYHHANVIGKYMVVSFGIGYDQSIESDILLLDISDDENYVWTDTFDPSTSSESTATTASPTSANAQPSESSNKSSPMLIGAIVGSLLVGALLSIGGFFLYKRWNKNRQRRKDVIKIPGSDIHDRDFD